MNETSQKEHFALQVAVETFTRPSDANRVGKTGAICDASLGMYVACLGLWEFSSWTGGWPAILMAVAFGFWIATGARLAFILVCLLGSLILGNGVSTVILVCTVVGIAYALLRIFNIIRSESLLVSAIDRGISRISESLLVSAIDRGISRIFQSVAKSASQSAGINPFMAGILLAMLAALFVPVQFLGLQQRVFFASLFQSDSSALARYFINWDGYIIQVGAAFVVGLILRYLSIIASTNAPSSDSDASRRRQASQGTTLPKTAFCGQCGGARREGTRFCEACGGSGETESDGDVSP